MSVFNPSDYLNQVLNFYKTKDQEGIYKKKREELKKALEQHFRDKIYPPKNSGSFKKRTAVSYKYDLDIVVPFKRGISLAQMFEGTYEFCNQIYCKKDGTLSSVRRQNVSIGLKFKVRRGRELRIDIVPGREVDQYQDNQNLELYPNNIDGLLQDTIRTNIHKQADYIQKYNEAKPIIKLLKVWNYIHFRKMSSFFLELVVIEAFKSGEVPKNGLFKKLLKVMEFIENHVEKIIVKDPGNKGNDVGQTLTAETKTLLSTRMRRIRMDLLEHPKKAKKYFPKCN